MELTVLVDNNTFIDQYYYGEPAVCYHLQDEKQSLLFDVGYSGIFMSNAKKMDLNIDQVSTIVLSHGHDDHAGGLEAYFAEYKNKRPTVVTHPDTFLEKRWEGQRIGAPFSIGEMRERSQLVLSREPVQLGEKLFYLGEIPSYFDFEKRKRIGDKKSKSGFEPDYVMEDSGMVYHGKEGLFLITACSHSGVCNMLEHAKKVCKETRIAGVIGGFHLFGLSPKLEKTISYFKEHEIKRLYPCHCISFQAKARMNEIIPIQEVGVGLKIDLG